MAGFVQKYGMPKNCDISGGKWCSKHHQALHFGTLVLDQIWHTYWQPGPIPAQWAPKRPPNPPSCSENNFHEFRIVSDGLLPNVGFTAGFKQNHITTVFHQGSWLGVAPQRAWAPRPSTVDAAGPCWKESHSTMALFSPTWHGAVVLSSSSNCYHYHYCDDCKQSVHTSWYII